MGMCFKNSCPRTIIDGSASLQATRNLKKNGTVLSKVHKENFKNLDEP